MGIERIIGERRETHALFFLSKYSNALTHNDYRTAAYTLPAQRTSGQNRALVSEVLLQRLDGKPPLHHFSQLLQSQTLFEPQHTWVRVCHGQAKKTLFESGRWT